MSDGVDQVCCNRDRFSDQDKDLIIKELLRIIYIISNPPAIYYYLPGMRSIKKKIDALVERCESLMKKLDEAKYQSEKWFFDTQIILIEGEYKKLKAIYICSGGGMGLCGVRYCGLHG